MSAAPRRDPTTIPAIEPPESPADVPIGAAEAVLEEVLEGNSGAIDVVVGRCTSAHRDSTPALTQHESVALGELEPQYEHSPWRLDW